MIIIIEINKSEHPHQVKTNESAKTNECFFFLCLLYLFIFIMFTMHLLKAIL
jgi:hypothetical protein